MFICGKGGYIIVCGYVPKDAEYKTVGDKASSLCKFSIKSDEHVNEQGEKETIWANCDCWHSVARTAKNIKKGDTVLAAGKMETQTYQKDGQDVQKKVLVCEFVSIMPNIAAEGAPAAKPVTAASVMAEVTDEDYPF